MKLVGDAMAGGGGYETREGMSTTDLIKKFIYINIQGVANILQRSSLLFLIY